MVKKILVVGGGGREHAICRALSLSQTPTEIYCAPGNAGIADIARTVEIAATDIQGLTKFAVEQQIDLTVVGGESSLALGIVDEFAKHDLKIVGASQAAARLETSKIFAKDFMTRHRIPTAHYRIADSPTEAQEILISGAFGDENAPTVIKADGLAAGKGVVVAKNRGEAIAAIEELMISNSVGAAANRIVLEETLTGREVSLLLFADGKNFALMPVARDHKRIGENDTGANTGGMGTITDARLLSNEELQKIVGEIIEPTLRGAGEEDFEFRGVLFLGLMMTTDGAKLLEYNVRFGDPETQAILVRLQTDFVKICEAVVNQNLAEIKVEFTDESSACVIIAAADYPAKPRVGDVIHGLDKAAQLENVTVFHGATIRDANQNFVTDGGRVLGVTATGANLEAALNRAYSAVAEISWTGAQFRRDIGATSSKIEN